MTHEWRRWSALQIVSLLPRNPNDARQVLKAAFEIIEKLDAPQRSRRSSAGNSPRSTSKSKGTPPKRPK